MRLFRRTTRLCAILAACAAALAGASLAAAPASALAESGVAGVWDISRADAPRGCRMTLRREETAPGRHALGAPAGCRKALPILANAAGWTQAEGGVLRLVAQDGGPLLDFSAKDGGRFEAIGPEGETYRLAAQGGGFGATRWASEGRIVTAQATHPRGAAAPTGGAPSRATIPGRYAILRDEAKDTGCMLTLEERWGHGPKGSSRAFLAPACRDQGLLIFDPVGWTLAGSRLTVYARKGHMLVFVFSADGVWKKDMADGGKPIALKRL